MPKCDSYDDLKRFLKSASGLRMSHIYKPAMLLAVMRAGGHCELCGASARSTQIDVDRIVTRARVFWIKTSLLS